MNSVPIVKWSASYLILMKYDIRLMKPFYFDKTASKLDEILKTGYLTEGPVTREFEERVAHLVGAQHSIATTNCTTALELALRAVGCGPGDEVIIPDYTYPATADVIYLVNSIPVIVDVERETRNMDMEKALNAVTENTKVIMPVSEFGLAYPSDILRERLDDMGRSDIYVIEDAACSIGSTIEDRKTGSMADITCFSFHPRKVITTGEGGMITTDNSEINDWISSFKKFGSSYDAEREEVVFDQIGTNCKLSNILAGVGLVQLDHLDDILSSRLEVAERYFELIEEYDYITPPFRFEDSIHTFQSYTITIDRSGVARRVLQKLRNMGIEVQIGTYSLHQQPIFADTKQHGKLENSSWLFENLLTLPLHHDLSIEDLENVLMEINRIAEE